MKPEYYLIKIKNIYPKLLLVVRIFSIPTAVLAFLIFYDVVMPINSFDEAKITSKYTYSHKAITNYSIKAQGQYDYNEQVGEAFYKKALKGDIVRLGLTRFFKEWKSLELIQNNKIVMRTRGYDIYPMGLFGLLFLVPLFSFLSGEKKNMPVICGFSLIMIEPVALGIWIFGVF